MKKCISTILVLVLVLVTCSYSEVSATDCSIEKHIPVESKARSVKRLCSSIDKKYYDAINDDLLEFKKAGIDSDLITDVSLRKNKIWYSLSFEKGITDYVNVENRSNGDTIFTVKEGQKEDVLRITANDNYYLDGDKVNFDISTATLKTERSAELKGSLSDTWYSSKNPCPKKSWVYKKTQKTANIAAKKKIKDCTNAVILSLISAALSPVGLAFSTCYAMAGGIIQAASNTNSKHMSAIIKIYYPKGGRNIGNNMWVEKYSGTFYPKKNYTGKATKEVKYKIKQYY